MTRNQKIIRKIAVLPVKAYMLVLAPLTGNQCRFYPTCSHYMLRAIYRHGVIRGAVIGLRRIGRCHPYARVQSWWDPVPSQHCLRPRCQHHARGVEN
jgi:hypothetical protein